MPRRSRGRAGIVVALVLVVGAGVEGRGVGAAEGAWVEVGGVEGEVGALFDSLRVRELRPGVWMHTSWVTLEGGATFPANGLIVDTGEGLWLVNTAWGLDHTETLLDWIDAELGRPLAGAVLTHFHDDSMGGSPALAARGVPMWAHPITLELGAGQGVPLPQALALSEAGSVVRVGGLEVYYPGPAHTRDNVMVWLPEEGILFGGCAVRPATMSTLGNTADADVPAWPGSIRRLLDRYGHAEVVVPSHGPPGGVELLRWTIELAEAGR